jgi:hypothetical protein
MGFCTQKPLPHTPTHPREADGLHRPALPPKGLHANRGMFVLALGIALVSECLAKDRGPGRRYLGAGPWVTWTRSLGRTHLAKAA